MLFCNYHWVDFMLIYAATIKSALHSLKGFVIKKDCKWVIPSDKVTCTVKSLLVAMSAIDIEGFFSLNCHPIYRNKMPINANPDVNRNFVVLPLQMK